LTGHPRPAIVLAQIPMHSSTNRRTFLQRMGWGAAALSLTPSTQSAEVVIPGFEKAPTDPDASKGWQPVSDRRLRVGIVGYGVCRFGAAFSFQDHPNVEIVAVSDLVPEQCAGLAQACRCARTYPSLEELVKDDRIEAVFVATDAPSHARHCIEVLKHGKHVACAVPAVFGSLEEADQLFEAVKKSGLTYMMFETSCYHEDLHAMREIYRAGGLGELVYSEGEYYHFMQEPIPSFRDWRVGLPPQWYPTHSNAYHLGVTGGSFISARVRAALPAWRSVGTRPGTRGSAGACVDSGAPSTTPIRGWRRTYRTPGVLRCRHASMPVATAAPTVTS